MKSIISLITFFVVAIFANFLFVNAQYEPGQDGAWSMGRIFWQQEPALNQFPVGHFDNSGTSFGVLSVGGGPMNLTAISVDMKVKSTANRTTNQPHYFGAYLYVYDSISDLPPQNELNLPPNPHHATRFMNFSTESWTNESDVYRQYLFTISDPTKSYVLWLIKLTEPDFNCRENTDNYVTFITFVLDRTLPSTGEVETNNKKNSISTKCHPKSPNSKDLFATPSKYANRRIEFLGDSITAGYCNNQWNSSKQNTTTSYANQSYVKTWDYLIAQNLKAQFHTIAWSGMGLRYNYDRIGTLHFYPGIYTRSCASVTHQSEMPWNFSYPGPNASDQNNPNSVPYLPEVVVINLGTNDFSNITVNSTEGAKFVADYKSLVQFITQQYSPSLKRYFDRPLYMFLTCGPVSSVYCPILHEVKEWWTEPELTNITVVEFPPLPENQTSCGHPNAAGDEQMVPVLESKIRAIVPGWK